MKKVLLRILYVCVVQLLFAFSLNAQIKVTGTVTSASDNSPLPGAAVMVVGTTQGVISDLDGKFIISVPSSDAVLKFSYIGFVAQEVKVGTNTTLNVQLAADNKSLDEVVVVGYGVVKKRDLTGSVASIKSAEITKTASNNALQSMQGKVAGLDVSKTSGETGAEVNIELRGNRSINASNKPLFLVDGIEYGSTLDINASDIESMEVLKDASSTAIYGSRGANGVVIITTKRGTSGDRSKVTFNSYLSFNSPTNLPKTMSVDEEYRFMAERKRYADEKGTAAWGTTQLSSYPVSSIFSDVVNAPYEKSLLTLYNEGGVDWYDLMMTNSVSQNYEASVSGGNAKTTFNISLGYMNEQGTLRNDELKRYNTRVNIDHKITDKIKVGTSLQFTYRDWDRRADGVYSQLLKMHALAQPYYANGTIFDKPSELATSHTNPLFNEVDGYYANNTKSNRLFGNVYADFEIIKNLKFKTVLGVDQNASRNGIYNDYMTTGLYQSGGGSTFKTVNDQSLGFTWENTINYSLKMGVNDIQILVGTSAQENTYESHGLSGAGKQDHYGVNSYFNLENILPGGRSVINQFTKTSMLSYFGRVNYKLMDKYLLTASLRADGASMLADGNKWASFPSVSAAWIMSEESFIKNISVINNLKLRASWGKAGNSAVSAYQTVTALGTDMVYYTFGSNVFTGLVPAVMGNPSVKWETTSTYDIGLDVALFNRVSATLDFYKSTTSDLLLYKGLPASSVYPQVLANVGETRNTGFEAAVNVKVINRDDLTWSSDISYSLNRDEITKLASGLDQDVSQPDMALKVGEAVRSFYGYEADGCWSIAEAEEAKAFGKVPGDVKIVDRDNNKVINDADKRFYNKSPKFILGWNNTINYKGFNLSALMYARIGQWIKYDYNTAYKPTEADGTPSVDFWTPENQGAKFPRPGITSQNEIPVLAYEQASYVKLKEITFGYTLPKALIQKAKLSKLYIYASLQNYFTKSNIDNYDPERGGSISNPLSKQFVVGLNLEF
jgi:TonB-dependent starch-binding outer membrane protein SusC